MYVDRLKSTVKLFCSVLLQKRIDSESLLITCLISIVGEQQFNSFTDIAFKGQSPVDIFSMHFSSLFTLTWLTRWNIPKRKIFEKKAFVEICSWLPMAIRRWTEDRKTVRKTSITSITTLKAVKANCEEQLLIRWLIYKEKSPTKWLSSTSTRF